MSKLTFIPEEIVKGHWKRIFMKKAVNYAISSLIFNRHLTVCDRKCMAGSEALWNLIRAQQTSGRYAQ